MKKAIALLLAIVVTFGLGTVAFAADAIPGTYGTADNTVTMLESAAITGTPATTVNVAAGELFLVQNNKIVGLDTELAPDETYKFDIYYALAPIVNQDLAGITGGDLGRKLTKADMGSGSVRVRTVKGSSYITSAKIKTVGSSTSPATTYRLDIETRPNYGVKMNDVEYNLSVNGATTANLFIESTHTFTVGYNTISDSDTDVGEGGTITISNDAPVIEKEQFSDIAKSANYKNIIFEADDGNWIFTGKVAGMKDSNFTFNYDPDTDLMNKFPDHEFKFVNFPAGVSFPTTGEMRIDVSDVSEDFSTMYAYLYRDGKLTEINTTYDSGADELIFRTNYLGKFVVTNRAITDTSLLPEEPEDIDDEEEEEYPPEVVPGTNGANNPNTGATSSANVMVTLGLLSLASAAVVSRKRK